LVPGRAERIFVIFDRSISTHNFRLQDERDVVYAVSVRKRRGSGGIIVDDEHPHQPHSHLSRGAAHDVRVVPIGRGGLPDGVFRIPGCAGRDDFFDAAVISRGQMQAVPVNRRVFTETIRDGQVDRIAFVHVNRRAQK